MTYWQTSVGISTGFLFNEAIVFNVLKLLILSINGKSYVDDPK